MYRVFIKYCVCFQKFSIFCDLFLASTGLYRKWPVNKSACTIRSQIRWVALLHAGVGLQWIGKKKHNLKWTHCIYLFSLCLFGELVGGFMNGTPKAITIKSDGRTKLVWGPFEKNLGFEKNKVFHTCTSNFYKGLRILHLILIVIVGYNCLPSFLKTSFFSIAALMLSL